MQAKQLLQERAAARRYAFAPELWGGLIEIEASPVRLAEIRSVSMRSVSTARFHIAVDARADPLRVRRPVFTL